MILLSVLALMGGSIAGIPNVNATINGIVGAWPDLGCQKTDLGCQINQWIAFVCCAPGSFATRVGAVFALGYQLVIGVPLAVATSVPVVGPIFVGFQIILALAIWTLFRHGNPGY